MYEIDYLHAWKLETISLVLYF